VVLGLAYGLAAYPLLDPDEGRNAEVAREMAATNDYVLPRLDRLPYVDKPALFFAAEAATMETLGATALAARVPPLLFTLTTMGLVAWFAARRSGRDAAWTAAVATGASPLTLGFARTVIMDSALTFFVVLALVAFYEAIEQGRNGGATERRYGGTAVERAVTAVPPYRLTALAWAALALAVLTKGPIGLALPLMVVIPYAAWRRAGRAIWQPVGPLLFLTLLLPWLMAMSRRVPDFLPYALGTESLVRVATPALSRTGPFWYFLPVVLIGALPWSATAIKGFRSSGVWRGPDGRVDPYTVFLLLWAALPFLFFSLSQSKRPQYVLPLVPAVALLVGHMWRQGGLLCGARAAAVAFLGAGGCIAAAPQLLPRWLALGPRVQAAVAGAAFPLAAITAAAGALLWFLRGRRDAAHVALALPFAAIPVAGGNLMREIARERSAAELAAAVAPVLSRGGEVVGIGAFPPSLPFYLRRPILVATANAAELTSNYLARDVARWREVPGSPLRPANWWLDAVSSCRSQVFVVRAADSRVRAVLAARIPLLIETPKYAAYGPCSRSDLAMTSILVRRPPSPVF
jgi:4-amino-4-deoxy-L-arabinose transferase-like glycosyltransferase